MLSTRIHTTILALVASVSFAAATVAPAVSQAQKNIPTHKTISHEEECATLAELFTKEAQAAEKYEREGDKASAEASLGIAQIYFEMGTEAQCWFPAVKHPPQAPPVSGSLPRVGPSLSAKAR